MPGAPNRPPETAAAPPAPVIVDPRRKVLRRLAPSRVALTLDMWKGAPSAELLEPLVQAEAEYVAGEWPSAEKSLDRLSVRFAEPRWPTMPVPFRDLRVAIPAPMPPHWDPDHAVEPGEKERRRLRRLADQQIALAKASVALLAKRGVAVDDLTERVVAADIGLPTAGADEAFWSHVDAIWEAVRERTPMPTRPGAKPPSPAPPAHGPA
jgi:hypothetical protein